MRSSTVGLLLAIVMSCAPSVARATPPGPTDWPMYGHDLHRSFHGVSSLTPAKVQALLPSWFFRTGDAVTANPIVVNGTVYVGSWDGFFYAIDATTGKERWHYKVKPQPSVHPATAASPRQSGRLQRYLSLLVAGDLAGLVDNVVADTTSDGGIVTASAFFYPGGPHTGGRDVVIFGAGYTLYALYASDGTEFFPPHDYPGTGCATTDGAGQCVPAGNPAVDEARIFSSPAVVGNHILFSVDADGQAGHRGYLVSAQINTGKPQWVTEIDGTDGGGQRLNDGCGNVWTSPTVIDILTDPDDPGSPTKTVEIVSTSDCAFDNASPYDEKTLAVDVSDGSIDWVFDPARVDNGCDWDFGATANAGIDPSGDRFLGTAGKDGTYYRIDPDRGTLVWRKNVVFGGFSGGFIGSTAFDGKRIYGATALGDFGRFEGAGTLGCNPGGMNADGHIDLPIQEPSVHAFDAETGAVPWQGLLSQSFGATTTAGGMVFVGTGVTRLIEIRSAAGGNLLKIIPLPAPSSSAIIPAGDSIYFGTGSSEQGIPAGVYAFRPRPPLLVTLLGLIPFTLPPLPLPVQP